MGVNMREPQPTDGPDYHAEHSFWAAEQKRRARFDWPWGELSAFRLVEEQVTVDGVVYDVARVRTLIHERHRLASEATAARMDVALWRGYAERRQIRIDQLEARLNRADTHLQRRTAALVRMIAKKGPRLDEGGDTDRTVTVVSREVWERLNAETDEPTPGLLAMVAQVRRRRGW